MHSLISLPWCLSHGESDHKSYNLMIIRMKDDISQSVWFRKVSYGIIEDTKSMSADQAILKNLHSAENTAKVQSFKLRLNPSA